MSCEMKIYQLFQYITIDRQICRVYER